MVSIAPNMPKPTRMLSTVVIEKAVDWNSRSGMIASLPIARSTRMNASRPTAPMTKQAIDATDVQPHSRPCSATSSSGASVPTTRVAPHQSIRGLPCRSCGTCRNAITISSATTPTGTLTRNTQRQPVIHRIWSAPANRPPISGPITDATPNVARKKPWYLARSRGARMSPMIASGSDIRPPAPRPWKARNAARPSIDVAKLDSSEPSTKMPMLVMNSGRRPNWSDSLPYSGVVTVAAIR